MPDRFEREIDDILSKLDKFPSRGPGYRARQAVTRRLLSAQRWVAVRVSRLSVGQIMLAGLALILVAFFFRTALPGIWNYLLFLGLFLFLTSLVISWLGGGRSGDSRQIYWRGRPASYYSSGPAFTLRLREWWRRLQGRRY